MRFRRSCKTGPLAVLLVAGFQLSNGALAADDPLADIELLLADVTVNGEAQGVTLLARADDEFLVQERSIVGWRLDMPAGAGVEIDGNLYFPLSRLEGITTSFSDAQMALEIEATPELLSETYLSLANAFEAPERFAGIGSYIDYDVAYSRGPLSGESHLSGFLRPTVFTAKGSLTNDLLYNNEGPVYGAAGTGWRRLSTTWTIDDPDTMRSYRFGDATTASSSWARSLRFGGFQLATNFGTRPTEVTFPQPSVAGTAAVPSSLDIYVNGQLSSQLDVPAGAFQIDNIPVVTGTGQVQVVARDLMGRQQLLTQDFYSSERLLRPGLNEYSLSAGRLRDDFAIRSNSYGTGILAGNFRRGLDDRMTVGGQFATTGANRMIDVSLTRSFGLAGVMTASTARSSGGGAGTLWLVGHQFLGRRFRGDVRIQGTTRRFSQPGIQSVNAFPKRQISMSGGIGMRQNGSAGVSLVRERGHAGRNRRISTLSYSRSLPSRMSFSVAVSHVKADSRYWEASVSLNRSLGPRSSTSAGFFRRDDGNRTRLAHRFELPAGPGYGYRTSVQQGTEDVAEAEFLLNTEFAHYAAEYRNIEGDGALRLQSRGSMTFFDGAFFATRNIDNSFAVVDTGAFDNVRVYLENRPIGRTREDGRLLVPGLRPYEINRIRIETSDVPVQVRIDASQLTVSPYFRAGTVVPFGLRATSSMMMRAVLPDSTPVPEGARAQIVGGDMEYPVGLDGRLFLEDVESGDRVLILYANRSCVLTIENIDPSASMRYVGDVICDAPDAEADESGGMPGPESAAQSGPRQ